MGSFDFTCQLTRTPITQGVPVIRVWLRPWDANDGFYHGGVRDLVRADEGTYDGYGGLEAPASNEPPQVKPFAPWPVMFHREAWDLCQRLQPDIELLAPRAEEVADALVELVRRAGDAATVAKAKQVVASMRPPRMAAEFARVAAVMHLCRLPMGPAYFGPQFADEGAAEQKAVLELAMEINARNL